MISPPSFCLKSIVLAGLLALAMQGNFVFAQETPPPVEPTIVAASGEGKEAIKQFRFSKSLQCELFAAEPDVANIVAFQRDYQGRFFVCESFRQQTNTGVEDNRYHAHWMDEELSAQTVQDRISYIRKYVPNADQLYTANDDRIRMLVDENRDGIADKATIFAKGFNGIEMGTGADVLSYRNKTYFTCVPSLFLLKDADNDGVADHRESLQSGYGVRFAFRGHDMHGLVVGPDGRLYFSIGDRGYNVSPEIADPTTGAVFRCELDGSDLEVFCKGLRNPQNLAFDDLGNLFTGDNNSDSGDKARWVYLVEGGDSGWRMYYQYLPDRGPFNREKIWHPLHDTTPPYIIPPVENFSDGPSGLEYYPGTGFGEDFKGRFFLCDFRGGAANSGIRSFRNQQVGAFWKLVDAEQPIWGILATDLNFGSDGKLYVSDWINGWVGENKGRIYSFADSADAQKEVVKEVENLLRDGLEKQPTQKLMELIGHADRRIRQEAQFELVGRDDFESLKKIALEQSSLFPRVHAVWGIEQLARGKRKRGEKIPLEAIKLVADSLIKDADPEIRAQAAQLVGDTGTPNEVELIKLLSDDSLRVRFYASMALGKIGTASSQEPVAAMLTENSNVDPIVRHGGAIAIRHLLATRRESHSSTTPSVNSLDFFSDHPSQPVRLALVVAIRKILAAPATTQAMFPLEALKAALVKLLDDKDGSVSLEAARVIHDLPVNDLMPELARIRVFQPNGLPRLEDEGLQDALLRRVINANFRMGRRESADRLATFATEKRLSTARRVDAFNDLVAWITPSSNDRVIHDWRSIDTSSRKIEDVQQAIEKNKEVLVSSPQEIQTALLEGVEKLKLTGLVELIGPMVHDSTREPSLRAKTLVCLRTLGAAGLADHCQKLKTEFAAAPGKFPSELLVELAITMLQSGDSTGLQMLDQLLMEETVSIAIKQQAIEKLGKASQPEVAGWFSSMIDKAKAGQIPAELRLDLLTAALQRTEKELKESAENYFAELSKQADPSAKYRDTLVGGDFEKGKLIFETKSEVSCLRCHRVASKEVAVGPNLADIGLKRTRQHILDSIVQPNKEIAEGFGQLKVQTIDGLIISGLLVSDNDTEIKLLDAEGKSIAIAKEDIEQSQPGMSSMPLDLAKNLSMLELRDLIEYLAGQKAMSEDKNSEHK